MVEHASSLRNTTHVFHITRKRWFCVSLAVASVDVASFAVGSFASSAQNRFSFGVATSLRKNYCSPHVLSTCCAKKICFRSLQAFAQHKSFPYIFKFPNLGSQLGSQPAPATLNYLSLPLNYLRKPHSARTVWGMKVSIQSTCIIPPIQFY